MGLISKSNITEDRPIYIPSSSKMDSLLRVSAFLLVLVLWISSIYFYFQLPDIISVHFNIHGEMDRTGSKIHFLIIPVIETVLYLLFAILVKYPENFNFPVKISADNAQRQYQLAVRLVRWLNVSLGFIFNIILWMMFVSSVVNSNKWIVLLIPVVIIFSLFPLVLYLIAASRI